MLGISPVWMRIFLYSVMNTLSPGVVEDVKKVWNFKESKQAG